MQQLQLQQLHCPSADSPCCCSGLDEALLLSALMTPPIDWSLSSAAFVRCLTASPAVELLLLLLLQRQRASSACRPESTPSCAIISSFLSQLQAELELPQDWDWQTRQLDSYRLHAAATVEQQLSACLQQKQRQHPTQRPQWPTARSASVSVSSSASASESRSPPPTAHVRAASPPPLSGQQLQSVDDTEHWDSETADMERGLLLAMHQHWDSQPPLSPTADCAALEQPSLSLHPPAVAIQDGWLSAAVFSPPPAAAAGSAVAVAGTRRTRRAMLSGGKRRRRSDELGERERWYCTQPGCSQFYRKSSTSSISRHRSTCGVTQCDPTRQPAPETEAMQPAAT